ncbi:MCE family protein [Pimelobacter simplex]|uniref:MCE family protein n=1 Tax=Nocardioides simplex TaxID=2045 RepID=UPI003AAF3604
MRAPTTRVRRTAAALLATVSLGLTGCGIIGGGVYDAPLPGGADVGDDPITITAEFTDVLDLVPQSNVKVDNVSVGRVTKVKLGSDGQTAVVEMVVRKDIDLPGQTIARLQQTSLLGEKYVALVRPEGGGAGAPVASRLTDGARLSTADTDAAATAEQVLGALSLVLSGGGVGQFQEISQELQKAGDGRTGEVKAFLTEVNRFVGVLDDRKEAITAAIDGLARLSKSLDDDKQQIVDVLDGLSPGMKVLTEQRPQLTRMLSALDRLSKVTVRTLDASQDDMVADLKALDPILTELAKAGDDLPRSMEILLTYPFPDSVLSAIKGDYLNVFITTNFRTPQGCSSYGCSWPQPIAGRPVTGGSGKGGARTEEPPPTMLPPTDSATPGLGTPTVPGPSILPTTPGGSPSGSAGTPSGSASGGTPSGSPSGSGSAPSQNDSRVAEGGE